MGEKWITTIEVVSAWVVALTGVFLVVVAVMLALRSSVPVMVRPSADGRRPSKASLVIVLGAAGFASLLSQIPVILGAEPRVRFTLWLVACPFFLLSMAVFAAICLRYADLGVQKDRRHE